MRVALAILLVVHALIHLMGFAKAFELARAPQLTMPISRTMGLVWLAAAMVLVGSSAALFAAPRWFWLLAIAGAIVSQAAIVTSWHDARFGTAANVLALVAGVHGAFASRPFGLRAEYEASTALHVARLTRLTATPPVTESELAPLPPLVQRYLRYAGVVGRPHVQGFRARFTGRIRSGPSAPWMPFTGEQHNFTEPKTRLFSMQATTRGLPVDGLHSYDESGARMRVKVLSLVSVVDAKGPDFTRTETVTLFNDMCVMAPATLLDPTIRWRTLDASSVEGTFTNGPHTIRAVLVFDDAGALVNFWSDDRPALAPDGVTFVPQRWSTPLRDYRERGGVRLASRGEARYAAPEGEYAYLELDGLDVSYDPRSP
ncbi:MAG: DUF6544 family protein [Labilithrix sp.]